MSAYETLRFDLTAPGVATIILDRPDEANTLTPQVARELRRVVEQVAEDPAVRAVHLGASGRFFSAGGDLRSIGRGPERPEEVVHAITEPLHAAIAALHQMDAPVVVAVNGTVAGGGMGLALAGDLVFCAASARFSMGFSRIGLSPDSTTTYLLPRLVGLRRAQELVFTDRVLSAAEALAWGLVTRVVPDDRLEAEAAAAAAVLAAGPTGAYGAAKRLLATTMSRSLEAQADAEANAIAALASSPDGAEGVASFLEKRPARFVGRRGL